MLLGSPQAHSSSRDLLLTWPLGTPLAPVEDGDDSVLLSVPGSGDRLALPSGGSLTQSLGALTTGVREVAAGDLTKNLAVADGPLGELAVSLNKLIYGMREFLDLDAHRGQEPRFCGQRTRRQRRPVRSP